MVFGRKSPSSDSDLQEEKAPSKILSLLQAIRLDPVALVSDLWDSFDMWRATRNWRPVIWTVPAVVLIAALMGTAAWGRLTGTSVIVTRYLDKAEQVAPIKEDGREKGVAVKKGSQDSELADSKEEESEKLDAEEQIKADREKVAASQFADVLFRRVLQVESKNKRARYYVANQMSLRGNRDQARAMMQAMAPTDLKGYEPAHNWLASDLLQQLALRKQVDRAVLYHHLSIASDWSGASPNLLSAYSQLLESEKRSREAIGMMQRAATRDASHYLALAGLFARYKQPTQAKEAVERAVQHYSASFGKKDEPDADRIAVAEAYLQVQKLEEAAKVLQQGLAIRADRPSLRRALSNVYRVAYRMQLKRTDTGIQANLNLLNAALAADPTNPLVGEEVALLQPMGMKPDENMIQTLQKQLAAGGATAVTHVLLGNAFFNRNNLEKAIIHWELALGQDPNMVLASNNLALAFAMKKPPDYEKAIVMIDKALQSAKDNPEVLDSKGEILALMNKHVEAIPFFESAIRIGPYRLQTREKLARSYEAAGFEEQSKAQWETLEKIREQVKKDQEEAAQLRKAQQDAAAAVEADVAAAAAAAAAAPTEEPPKEPESTSESKPAEESTSEKTDSSENQGTTNE